eukprot:TRINITY_DN11461_c0_g1_i1.p1 TRINITY_DN11461_c0_g1~~TRINITY_DN11461_c0_g1_i1.p1  ORF type:complete len:414 (-),score=35.41 TRINITY_DN11461_c0_g1_i1:173-1330(-)
MASRILCSGNLDFVYGINPATGIVEVTPSFANNSRPTYDMRMDLEYHRETILSFAQPHIHSLHGWKSAHVPLEPAGKVHLSAQHVTDALEIPHMTYSKAASEPVTFWLPRDEAILQLAHKASYTSIVSGTGDGACGDSLPASSAKVFFARFGILFPKEVNASDGDVSRLCNLLQPNCWKYSMTAVRALCPESCGCNDPFSPAAAFYTHEKWGCMKSCRSLAKITLRMHGNKYLCQDAKPELFMSNKVDLGWRPDYSRFIKGVFEFLRSEPSSLIQINSRLQDYHSMMGLGQVDFDKIRDFMLAPPESNRSSAEKSVVVGLWELAPGIAHPRGLKGCAYLTSWEIKVLWDLDLCQVGSFRSLRFHCPISCGCKAWMAECPPACPAI